MSAAAELQPDQDTGPRIQLGSKLLDKFEAGYELVQLQPPRLRARYGDEVIEYDSMKRLVEAIERGDLVLLQRGMP